ncbi:MAG: hypothetical protein AAGC44_05360 [Planctomycetota bacterium]
MLEIQPTQAINAEPDRKIIINGQEVGRITHNPDLLETNRYLASIKLYDNNVAQGFGATPDEAVDNAFIEGATSLEKALAQLRALRDEASEATS